MMRRKVVCSGRPASKRSGPAAIAPTEPHTAGKRKSAAFTLIELLTVISIIAILAGILIPSVTRAVFAVRVAKTHARITAIKAALGEYHTEHGFFPGQNGMGGLTGSQWLARAMFTPKGGAYPADFPKNSYMDYKPEMLDKIAGQDYSFGDGFSEQMAICYYPARLDKTGLEQFDINDNSDYTDDNTSPSSKTFNEFITDERFGETGRPIRAGDYIVIAPGIDRKYFTDDDVTNR